jgi:hypothetical protein
MPLNTLRLNHQKSSHPNDRIVFIKPLPRPPLQRASHDLADTFLRAIAAQCLPIMKDHHLSVTTLEEHEPNREFVGRNFNNGEIIQLVLRSGGGGWLPFHVVQMVMMHELAHNAHMNHGKMFWKTRNRFADEMKSLWARGYTGEGFWGGGRTLTDMGAVMGDNILGSAELEGLPLCGGTYRSRRRTRKRGPELTWKEKKERRIERKFGRNGVALGEDEDRRLHLEINRKGGIGGKPRVAQSKRGRELRAAAALARFETNKKETAAVKDDEDDTDEGEDYEDGDASQQDATDVDGSRLLDRRGQGMIRVCDREDPDGEDARHEQEELEGLDRYFKPVQQDDKIGTGGPPTTSETTSKADKVADRSGEQEQEALEKTVPQKPIANADPTDNVDSKRPTPVTDDQSLSDTLTSATENTTSTTVCPICSLENSPLAAACLACSHVLDPKKDPRHWACRGEECAATNSAYLNPGDAGVCGICGRRRAG